MAEVPSYVNKDGSQTKHAEKMGDCFDLQGTKEACAGKRAELKELVKTGLPDQAQLDLPTYTVTANDGKGLFGVLQKMQGSKLNEVKYAQLAYGNLSAQVNKKGSGNIDLLVPGDTVTVVNGVITVTRKAGSNEKSWSANLYPWGAAAAETQAATPITPAAEPSTTAPAAPEKSLDQQWQEYAQQTVSGFQNKTVELGRSQNPFGPPLTGKGITFAEQGGLTSFDPLLEGSEKWPSAQITRAITELNKEWVKTHPAAATKPATTQNPSSAPITPTSQKPQGKGPEAGEH